ncbi:carboxypeptidase regulatory-like domain-containing protein [soil metagenome]
MRKILLVVSALMLSASLNLLAQVTTSNLSGSLKDKNGAIPGANVVAVHGPTGTTYGTVSSADGKFTIANMRVGGPYQITISFIGYKTQTYSDITLLLGETYVLNHILTEEGTQLEELVITGQADQAANIEKNGAVTNITSAQLLSMPTISRGLNDMLRMVPQSSSGSTGAFGGGNYRQNNFTIDGSDFNNSFGIGNNLPGAGNPISLDALEAVTINITPYDIRQSGFIGSSMNAVTRSGSNTFSGSVFTFFRNQNQQGNEVQKETPFVKQNLSVETYGFRVGGPIIKNKLFFFLNAESSTEVRPGQANFAATPENPYTGTGNIARPTAAQLDTYSAYLANTYQYETGPYQGYDFKTTNVKITAKIDWNINEKHRLSVRYSQVENKSPSFVSTSRTGLGTNAPQTRTSLFALPYKNANYYQENNLYSVAAELNSLFGSKFANTLRLTYTDQNEPRSSDSRVFPFVDILDGSQPATSVGTISIPVTSFGYEPFTYGNLRKVSTVSVVDNLSWTSGNHGFTVGLQADMTSTKNGFQRAGTSAYTFNSWADFQNGAAPRDFAITYSLLPGYEQAFPTVKTSQYSVYGQDEIQVSDKLKLTAGLRLDLPMFNETKEIQTHPLVAGLTFAEGRKIDTGVLPDSKILFSPRVGFNYDIKGDRSMVLRGGTGVFTGKIPMVWIVAQSGDAGLIQFTQTIPGQTNVLLSNITTFNPDPNAYRPPVQPTPGSAIPSSVSALTKDFAFPQTWKSSLAFDMKLPFGVYGTLEAIFNKDINVARGINPNLVEGAPLSATGYPDNRIIYPNAFTDKYINPLTITGQPVATGSATGTSQFQPVVLTNAQQGYYASLTVKLEKPFANGLNAMVAYTRTEQQVIYDGSGDQLLNTWSLTQTVNSPNFAPASFSGFTVPDRFIAAISYRKEYLKHLATSISLFYEGSIQGRYSYTYGGDFNRDGVSGNDLIYIPKSPSEITFATLTTSQGTWTPTEQSALFFKYIDQDPYLSQHKGQYAERNGAELPWRSQVDIKFAQDIFTNIGRTKNVLQFTFDIFNIGNLLNKEWGVFKAVNNAAILVPTNTAALTTSGGPAPTFRIATVNNLPLGDGTAYTLGTFRNVNSIASTYYMQFGFRYSF